jgi:hypothetical protein
MLCQSRLEEGGGREGGREGGRSVRSCACRKGRRREQLVDGKIEARKGEGEEGEARPVGVYQQIQK